MIFQDLTLQNFGQYKGKHKISLVTTKTEPILLIGGHNGGGKTTILDAMQLCLYGKRSNAFKRSDQRWADYLRSWINRDAEPTIETRIKLSFKHPYRGRETDFKVEFSWISTGKGIKERKDVFINNILDQAISTIWDQYIDSILPAKLSTLFFFDGEQIENLVRPETAQEFLESAIVELLGIGTIEQLQQDLSILNRNKSINNKSESEVHKLKVAENQYETVDNEIQSLEDAIVSLKNQRSDIKKKIAILDSEYEYKGGTLLDERSKNETLKKELEKQSELLSKQIIKERSGVLPLFIVKDQLSQIKEQVKVEVDVANCIQQLSQYDQIHEKHLIVAEENGASRKVINALTNLATTEKQTLNQKIEDADLYLGFPTDSIPLLEAILHNIPEREKEYNQLLKDHTALDKRIRKINIILDSTPEEGELESLYNERVNSTKLLLSIESDIQFKEDKLQNLQSELALLKERVVKLIGENARVTSSEDDNNRIISYSLKAQQYLDLYKDELVKKHLETLELQILESFNNLVNKKSLVNNLRIDTASFLITLTNSDGKKISADKLSAGERQLLAVAIFWGLQKASNRTIPVIVDTPMGRLDSVHREHLINRYFPNAAHQVILLSTDEEIYGDYYERISSHISNEWTIKYDEEKQTTKITEGYLI